MQAAEAHIPHLGEDDVGQVGFLVCRLSVQKTQCVNTSTFPGHFPVKIPIWYGVHMRPRNLHCESVSLSDIPKFPLGILSSHFGDLARERCPSEKEIGSEQT